MNWNKANRILLDVTCIILILILPLWAIEMIGIERIAQEQQEGAEQ